MASATFFLLLTSVLECQIAVVAVLTPAIAEVLVDILIHGVLNSTPARNLFDEMLEESVAQATI